jgi:hypothetical protein
VNLRARRFVNVFCETFRRSCFKVHVLMQPSFTFVVPFTVCSRRLSTFYLYLLLERLIVPVHTHSGLPSFSFIPVVPTVHRALLSVLGKENVKLSLYFYLTSWKRIGGVEVQPHSFFDLGIRCRWVVSFTLRLLYPHGKSPCYALYRRLGGLQNRSGHGGE